MKQLANILAILMIVLCVNSCAQVQAIVKKAPSPKQQYTAALELYIEVMGEINRAHRDGEMTDAAHDKAVAIGEKIRTVKQMADGALLQEDWVSLLSYVAEITSHTKELNEIFATKEKKISYNRAITTYMLSGAGTWNF